MGPPWRIDRTIHPTMSERSYHGATSRSEKKWIRNVWVVFFFFLWVFFCGVSGCLFLLFSVCVCVCGGGVGFVLVVLLKITRVHDSRGNYTLFSYGCYHTKAFEMCQQPGKVRTIILRFINLSGWVWLNQAIVFNRCRPGFPKKTQLWSTGWNENQHISYSATLKIQQTLNRECIVTGISMQSPTNSITSLSRRSEM